MYGTNLSSHVLIDVNTQTFGRQRLSVNVNDRTLNIFIIISILYY